MTCTALVVGSTLAGIVTGVVAWNFGSIVEWFL
jgi:hypothetical protein